MDGDQASTRRTAPQRRRWPFGVALTAVLLALVAHWTNGQLRQHEFNTLLGAAADAQSTGDAAAAEVLSTRAYTMPLLVSSSSATVRAGLEQLIEQSAATGVATLQKERDQIAKVNLVPWHTGLRDARRADLAYVDQRIADFEQVVDGADLGLLNSTAATAAVSKAAAVLRAAAPSAFDAASVTTVMKPES
ncbi:MAG: hypothetical protein ACRDV3_09955 [Acidothermaceae bacterium]